MTNLQIFGWILEINKVQKIVKWHSAHLAVTPNGATVAAMRYLPFGEPRWEAEDMPGERGYRGQRQEGGFGLMDYNARYYSATLGRFISPDSIIPDAGNSMDWDRYAYTRNNPVMYNDPSGHDVGCSAADPKCYESNNISEPSTNITSESESPFFAMTPIPTPTRQFPTATKTPQKSNTKTPTPTQRLPTQTASPTTTMVYPGTPYPRGGEGKSYNLLYGEMTELLGFDPANVLISGIEDFDLIEKTASGLDAWLYDMFTPLDYIPPINFQNPTGYGPRMININPPVIADTCRTALTIIMTFRHVFDNAEEPTTPLEFYQNPEVK